MNYRGHRDGCWCMGCGLARVWDNALEQQMREEYHEVPTDERTAVMADSVPMTKRDGRVLQRKGARGTLALPTDDKIGNVTDVTEGETQSVTGAA